ncbi:FxSxx-COOH system tetratricopeptide repeat protein [Streptomyces caniferus]|uniref:FxSxx-COOH system tetratricopeptide repeat protein n=1 Tax=Streptomyces caniferus TaxID=285557 RepID=UPI0033CC5DDB
MADGGQVAYYAAPRGVTWPHQVGVLPRQAGCFQDRAAVEQLEQAVDRAGTAVLTGMGGVGKTQLAAHHARQVWAKGGVDLLLWISATTREAVISAYAQAAAEVLGADLADAERAARAFLAWLEPKPDTAQRRWLVVLDDVADAADVRDLWPPASPQGHTLITTRRRDAALTGSGRGLVPVGLFTPDEAVAYLAAALSAHGRPESPDQFAMLATDLGHLPLALSQAVAYLIDADLDCAAFCGLLAERAHTLTDVLPDSSGLPDDQPTSVAAAWSLSIDRADRLPPAGLARPMLRLTALLDPNGIPTPVLVSPPVLLYLTAHRTDADGQACAEGVTARDASRVLRALHRLSLMDQVPGNVHQAVRVHQLVQRAIRDTLLPEQHDQLARVAADAVTDAWPDVERDTAFAHALRANADALTRCAEDALYGAPDAHPVVFYVGQSLGDSGQLAAAVEHFQHVADTLHTHLGPDHPDTYVARKELAHWQGEAGDLAGAVSALEELLDQMLPTSAPGDPGVLAVRQDLALRRGDAGDAVGAVAAFEELCKQTLRALGPDHPHTLIAQHNLATTLGEAGDPAGAVAAFEELLPDRERILGPDHPDTLLSRAHLAHWRGEAGDPAGAVAAFEELLPDRERILGPDHPDTFRTRVSIGRSRGKVGDAGGAVEEFAQLLDRMLPVLGPDHPEVLTARHNLAHWTGEAGDAAGAVTAFKELLGHMLRVLGPDHPDVLTARHNLATALGKAGDPAGAVAAFEELLPDRERVLSPDHPFTLVSRHDLAAWRVEAGMTGSLAALEEVLHQMQQALGPEHPFVINAERNLVGWQREAGSVGARQPTDG